MLEGQVIDIWQKAHEDNCHHKDAGLHGWKQNTRTLISDHQGASLTSGKKYITRLHKLFEYSQLL